MFALAPLCGCTLACSALNSSLAREMARKRQVVAEHAVADGRAAAEEQNAVGVTTGRVEVRRVGWLRHLLQSQLGAEMQEAHERTQQGVGKAFQHVTSPSRL